MGTVQLVLAGLSFVPEIFILFVFFVQLSLVLVELLHVGAVEPAHLEEDFAFIVSQALCARFLIEHVYKLA